MDDAISSDAPSELKATLGAQEHLQWWGRPRQGIFLRKSDIGHIPFSILWAGFAFFWEYQVITEKNAPFFFMLWGIPFILIGLYMLVGRFFYDAWRRMRTYYGLTSERAIIAYGRSYKSIDLAACQEIRVEKFRDGRGSIAFGAEPAFYSNRGLSGWSGQPMVPTLEGIEDADRVIAMIRRLQKEARATGVD